MKKLFLASLLIYAGLQGPCQQYIARLNIDSLKKVLLVAKDTQRINTLNLLSRRILFGDKVKGYKDTAGRLAAEALSLSKKLHYGKGSGNALLNQAIIGIGTTDQTLSSLQTALPPLQQGGDWFSVAGCFGLMGELYHSLGENNTAIIYYDSSIHLFQQLGDTVTSVWQMIPKAHSYSDLGNLSAAYKIFHTAQELTLKKDTLLQGYAYCYMAQLFWYANLPEIAIEYMNKVRSFYQTFTPQQQKNLFWQLSWASRVGGEAFLQLHETDSAFNIASFLNIPFEEQDPPDNLFYGNLYSAMGQYEKALVYYRHGYKVSLNTSYEIGHAMHANGLASTYLILKDFPKAIYYANEAIRVSKKMHLLLVQKNALGTLSNIYAATKNYTKAYYYNQLYKTLSDSLAPEEYKRKLSLVQVKDELEMQKKESQLLSNQNQISQQQIKIQESSLKRRSLLLYIFIAALLVMVLLAVLLNRNIKLKRRKIQLQQLMEQVNAQQKLTELEKEKTDVEMQALRAQMNPHFIFNSLNSINRFILQNDKAKASEYLTKFSKLVRMILQNSQNSLITLESELASLKLYLDLEALRFDHHFDYHINIPGDVDSDVLKVPPLILQPYVENAIWHGLMHKDEKGRLAVEVIQENNNLFFKITDDGVGRKKATDLAGRSPTRHQSMGLKITAERISMLQKQNAGDSPVRINDLVNPDGSPAGTEVIIKMPLVYD